MLERVLKTLEEAQRVIKNYRAANSILEARLSGFDDALTLVSARTPDRGGYCQTSESIDQEIYGAINTVKDLIDIKPKPTTSSTPNPHRDVNKLDEV